MYISRGSSGLSSRRRVILQQYYLWFSSGIYRRGGEISTSYHLHMASARCLSRSFTAWRPLERLVVVWMMRVDIITPAILRVAVGVHRQAVRMSRIVRELHCPWNPRTRGLSTTSSYTLTTALLLIGSPPIPFSINECRVGFRESFLRPSRRGKRFISWSG